jgi:hypothetical protein
VKTFSSLILAALTCSPAIGADQEKAGPPTSPTPASGKSETTILKENEKLRAAAAIGRQWQEKVTAGDVAGGMALWGYAAFGGITVEALQARLTAETNALGKLKYSELLEDRCLIDMDETDRSPEEKARGIYVTLRYFSEYDKGVRRETLIVHEPEKGGTGMKITGLRREELSIGRQGVFDLAADIGQLALLKLHGAPPERWEPYQREATALATLLKIEIPAIPDSAGSNDREAGGKLANLVMHDAVAVFDKLGKEAGATEAKAVLNAFALLMLYLPGDETSTRLAVLAGSEAEKAKLPAPLWKPIIKAVSDKEKLPAINDAVQRMVTGVSEHIAKEQLDAEIRRAPRAILNAALANMANLPTYHVRAELTAADGRRSVMDAALAPGVMDLTLQGFDGRRERRLVNAEGYRISRDEGKTWEQDRDPDTASGLCRTVQWPLDLSRKITEKHDFTFVAAEKIDDEQLFRFEASDAAGQPSSIYWVLMSRRGPVIRRARLAMTFADLETDAVFVYTRLGKSVDVPESGEAPE